MCALSVKKPLQQCIHRLRETRRGRAWVHLIHRALALHSMLVIFTTAATYLLLCTWLPTWLAFNFLLVLPVAHLFSAWETKLPAPQVTKPASIFSLPAVVLVACAVVASMLYNALLLHRAGGLLSQWSLVARFTVFVASHFMAVNKLIACADLLAPLLIAWFAGTRLRWHNLFVSANM